MNILLLGPPGHGKSSVANSLYRIITGDSSFFPMTTARSDATKKGTQYYKTVRSLPNLANIYLFDTPGFNLTEDNVSHVLGGIKEDCTQSDWKVMDITKKKKDDINRIHYVIYVISAKEIEKKNSSFWRNTYDVVVDNKILSDDIVRLIRETTGFEPYLVVSHANSIKLSQDHHLTKLSNSVCEIRFVENYIKTGGPKNIQTDSTLVEVLLTIMERVEDVIQKEKEEKERERFDREDETVRVVGQQKREEIEIEKVNLEDEKKNWR